MDEYYKQGFRDRLSVNNAINNMIIYMALELGNNNLKLYIIPYNSLYLQHYMNESSKMELNMNKRSP